MTPTSSPYHGWIDTVLDSSDPSLDSWIFVLFALNGALMNSILKVNRLGLVKFVPLNERLAEWARFMLSNTKDGRVLVELCSPVFEPNCLSV
ncbi:hypothetical protein NL676_022808 [Syzygium grande]|nr:hypothetical protein NL676_022808 [Syzygium grande]